MTTRVLRDESAPRHERYRVLRQAELAASANRWVTVESFPTLKEADAFARGLVLGWGWHQLESRRYTLQSTTGLSLSS